MTTAVKLPVAVGLVERVKVSDVVVAAVTVPTAPPLSETVLLARIGSKPKPLMTSIVPFSARLAVLVVTTGVTVATWTAVLLATLLVVTTTVSVPADGFVLKETVKEVAVAAVTVPIAPLLNATVLLDAVVSKPEPLIVSVATLAATLEVLIVATGLSEATWTAALLLIPLVVTVAVRFPAVGAVEKVTVSAVGVAAVTVPTAPLLKDTVLSPTVELKPNPLMVMVVAVNARFAVLRVTAGMTLATWTLAPLLTPFVVTTAVRLPAFVGFVERVTVSEVAVAEETVPTAPLLKVTVLFPAVVSNPIPLIVIVEALASKFVRLLVTTALTAATWADPVLIPLVLTVAVRLPAFGLVV